ncbi:MAG: glycosyltransferase family 9 protein [Ignavibacteria bacterium]|nr:glycosyltransferase family 9 protein [Ignavibacteria bacterium]
METLGSNSIKRILVIQTAFLGDVLLSLPIAHHLKKNNPAYEVSYLIKKELSQISEIFHQIDEYILIDKSKYFSSIKDVLKKIQNKFDVIIAPHRSSRTALISFFSKAPVRISFDKSSLNFLYTHLINYRKDYHEVQRNLSLIQPIVKEINWKEKISLKLDNYIMNDTFMSWRYDNKKIIVIAPGTNWETKRYPEYYFGILTKKFIEQGFKVVLIGANQDFEIGLRIEKQVKDEVNLLNLIGKLTLKESISLINLSDLLICNDSAPTHMAVFTDTPILTIYGSTVPGFGFYPFRDFDRIVQIENLSCKPCGIHGHKKCPEKHFKCMIDLKPEIVFKEAVSILEKK